MVPSCFCDIYDADDDYHEDDAIDFCGMNSNTIVEITLRRDFLLLKLQELVDAKTPQQAEKAIKSMERETMYNEQLLKFLVRAGTYEIIQDVINAGVDVDVDVDVDASTATATATATATTISPSVVEPLLQKLSYYHEQRQLSHLKKERRRGIWGRITSLTTV